jgi:hypothetical protein
MLFCIIGGESAKARPICINDAYLVAGLDFEYLTGECDLTERLSPRDNWYHSLSSRIR